jgi:glycosyltransferase involved in cell wall biosynthesis
LLDSHAVRYCPSVKVVLCNTLYPPEGIGGPERSVKIIAEGLVALGHEVTVVGQSLTPFTHSKWINGVKRIGIGSPPGYEPHVGDNRGPVRKLKKKAFSWARVDVAEKYREAVSAEKPDVIHTNVVHPTEDVLKGLSSLGVPVVHTLRIYHLMCNERMYFQEVDCRVQCAACAKRFKPNIEVSNKVAAVVGISRYVLQRHLDAGYFPDVRRRYVVGNSYDIAPHLAHTASAPREPTGRFLFMGRIHPSKGIRLIIDLAKRSPSPDFSYRICGQGHPSYEAEVRTLLQGTHTEWLGFASHDKAFESVDWLVVPSLWGEPFGRVVIEAFAHGVPVIASDGGAFPELIEHGKNGFLFTPDDPNSLVEIARGIAEGRYEHQKMRECALESAKRFSSSDIARRYEQIYRDVQDERVQ